MQLDLNLEAEDRPTAVLPCITLHRPWSLWVREGWKTIETRTHARFRSLEGSMAGIHSSQAWDDGWWIKARNFLTKDQKEQTREWRYSDEGRGMLLGCSRIRRFIGRLDASYGGAALIECDTPRMGLELGQFYRCREIKMKGAQGIFKVPLQMFLPVTGE